MTEKKSEMSLDEVLSSIKKMVVDTEPPVLDLTNMVKDDGTVVKVGESETDESMGTFLKLAQDSAEEEKRKFDKDRKTDSLFPSEFSKTSKNDVMIEIFKDIAAPEVRKWLDVNLPKMVPDVIQPVIYEWLEKNINKWLDDNLPRTCGKIAEREISNLLSKSKIKGS